MNTNNTYSTYTVIKQYLQICVIYCTGTTPALHRHYTSVGIRKYDQLFLALIGPFYHPTVQINKYSKPRLLHRCRYYPDLRRLQVDTGRRLLQVDTENHPRAQESVEGNRAEQFGKRTLSEEEKLGLAEEVESKVAED